MKKRQIKRFFLTVPVVLGLSLVACGASGNVAGDDWRTSGVVAGSGTITHDGQSDVLVSFIDEYGDNLSTITIGEEDQDTAEKTGPAMNLEDYVGLWEYQGEKAFEYLTGGCDRTQWYRLGYGLVTFLGAVCSLEAVWDFSDICNGLMAVPNLLAVLTLSRGICREIRKYNFQEI